MFTEVNRRLHHHLVLDHRDRSNIVVNSLVSGLKFKFVEFVSWCVVTYAIDSLEPSLAIESSLLFFCEGLEVNIRNCLIILMR